MTHIGVLLVVGLALRVVGAIPVVFAVLPVPSYISKDASCLSYSQTGCAEAAAASYALDCVIDDPTGYSADDRDSRIIYLPGSVTQAAPLTLEITSCSYMYTTSATAAMDPFSNDDLTVSSGVNGDCVGRRLVQCLQSRMCAAARRSRTQPRFHSLARASVVAQFLASDGTFSRRPRRRPRRRPCRRPLCRRNRRRHRHRLLPILPSHRRSHRL